MAYDPYEWKNGEEGETPITAERLNSMEQGIAGAAEISDLDALAARVTALEDAEAG